MKSSWLAIAAAFAHACAAPAPAPALAHGGEASTAELWDYSIRLDGEYLSVEGTAPSCRGLEIEPAAVRYVEGLMTGYDRFVAAGGPALPARDPMTGGRPCRFNYRFALFRAARVIDDVMIAAEHQGAVIAPASTWLLRPPRFSAGARFRVHVDPETHAALGLQSIGSHTYEGPARSLWKSPLAIFGTYRERWIEAGGGVVEVAIAGFALDRGDDVVHEWTEQAALDVTAYYGAFPVPRVLSIVLVTGGDELAFATTLGNGGASIVSPVGQAIDRRQLANDWQMTHEMTHLGFPNLQRRHHWLEEGIATYVEPLARARRGRLSVHQLWKDLYEGLPKGQPERGDRGLDHTHTWGRTYWGGALFCFIADVTIRARTENERSLDDALRAIRDAGGDIRVDWTIDQLIETGDRATGVTVLAETYALMADKPRRGDLESLFDGLGVAKKGGFVVFDDRAPLAYIRRSMTATTSGALGHR